MFDEDHWKLLWETTSQVSTISKNISHALNYRASIVIILVIFGFVWCFPH